MYSVPPVPIAHYRPLRRWRCSLCKQPISDEQARKVIRRTLTRDGSRFRCEPVPWA
jgi:hypothetical protein